MNRPVYCFIDDSPFEIRLFKSSIESRIPEIEFIYASTFRECKHQLDQQAFYPSLFILDLYGREGKRTGARFPTKSLMEARTSNLPTLDSVFDGLKNFGNDKDLRVNEYLKRLFTIVNEWRNIFAEQCESLDQGSQYGINNLKQVRNNYPTSAAVMYTRKGLFSDVVELSDYKPDGIFIKPHGESDKDIFAETKSQANHMIDRWNECVRTRYCFFLREIQNRNNELQEFLEMVSRSKDEIISDKKSKQQMNNILTSVKDTLANMANWSTLAVNGLTLWTRFYYGLY